MTKKCFFLQIPSFQLDEQNVDVNLSKAGLQQKQNISKMRKSVDQESTCSGAQRKRGFSLRRLLSASHILGHRSPRPNIATNKRNPGNLTLFFSLATYTFKK